jgi:hypothetical protein
MMMIMLAMSLCTTLPTQNPKRKRMSSEWVVGAVLEYWGTGTHRSPIQSSKMLGFDDQRETITCSPTRGSSVEKIKFANTYMKDDI